MSDNGPTLSSLMVGAQPEDVMPWIAARRWTVTAALKRPPDYPSPLGNRGSLVITGDEELDEPGVDFSLFRHLIQREHALTATRAFTPSWSAGGPLPGMIIAQHYRGSDARGTGILLHQLDTAYRRAGATVLALSGQGEAKVWDWERPIHPESAGLRILESRSGSFESMLGLYGELVAIAHSSPVSLASLAFLAWDATASAKYVGRWAARLVSGTANQMPDAAGPTPEGLVWSESQSAAFIPVMMQAVEEGLGADFYCDAMSGVVQCRVFPGQRTDD